MAESGAMIPVTDGPIGLVGERYRGAPPIAPFGQQGHQQLPQLGVVQASHRNGEVGQNVVERFQVMLL
jgi:hypothetical protein